LGFPNWPVIYRAINSNHTTMAVLDGVEGSTTMAVLDRVEGMMTYGTCSSLNVGDQG
jgi:hypothetical protein